MQMEHFIYRMISCFLWVVNAAIQPLEKSASKLLICNGRIFNASALRVFDASRDREKKGPERAEWALDRASGPAGEVRKLPQKPPYFRRPRNEKGKPRVVDLIYLVEGERNRK